VSTREGGKTRGENQALDHDFGTVGKSTPCGILDEDSGQLYLHFGCSLPRPVILWLITCRFGGRACPLWNNKRLCHSIKNWWTWDPSSGIRTQPETNGRLLRTKSASRFSSSIIRLIIVNIIPLNCGWNLRSNWNGRYSDTIGLGNRVWLGRDSSYSLVEQQDLSKGTLTL
jgi:hypothetical protein